MKNIPKKHHYIPQFILRQFCSEDNFLWYQHKDTGVVESLDTTEVFMEKYLYYFEDNDKDYFEIEENLSKYESEISKLLLNQFYDEKIISITKEEQESIKLFYAIMGFRSKRAADFFKHSDDKQFVDFYSSFQDDKDFEKFWKKNLKELVKCRSFAQVNWNPKIDFPIQMFIRRDTTGLWGSYLKIVESENEEFLLTDAYPLVIYGNNKLGMELNCFEAFPISPKRAILIMYDKVDKIIDFNDSVLPKGFYTKPEEKDGKLVFRVKKIRDEIVKTINSKTLEVNEIGAISYSGKFK